MTLTRLQAFYTITVLDAAVFMVGSFAANLMIGPLDLSWPMYLLIAALIAGAYGLARWLLAKPERTRLIASQTLAYSLGDSAEAYGIDAFYNMQRRRDQDQRNTDTRASIDQAQWMRLAANSGASYLSVGVNRHWPNVRQRLTERTPFRVVLLDPYDSEGQTRRRFNAAGEVDDAKLQIGDIVRACNQYPDLEVRFANTSMTCTVFITNNEAYLDPYHLAQDGGRITNLFLCMRTRKMQAAQGLSHYEIISRHFDSLWSISIPLQRWLEENAEFLPQLPALTANRAPAAPG